MILMDLFFNIKYILRMEAAGRSPILEHVYQTSQSLIAMSPHHLVTMGYTELMYFGFVGRVRRCYQLLTPSGGDTLSQETITRPHYLTQATNNRHMQLIRDRCWCSSHLHTLATEGAG